MVNINQCRLSALETNDPLTQAPMETNDKFSEVMNKLALAKKATKTFLIHTELYLK